MTRHALAHIAAALLVISAVAFVIGVSRERAAEGTPETHQDAAPTVTAGAATPTPTHVEAGVTSEPHAEEGESGGESETHNEAAPSPTHDEAVGAPGEVAPTSTHDEAAEAAGGHNESGEAAGAHTEANRDILGIDPESTGAVAAAVAFSLLLALAVWFWGTSVILAVAVAFGLLFAALDIREGLHQADESRGGLVALALVIAALHVGVALAAGAALKKSNAGHQL